MKKAIAAAILGIALNVTTTRAQGYIIMENYRLVGGTNAVYSGVSYGPGAGSKANQYVGAASGFKADLLYSLDGGVTYNLAAGSQTPFYGTFNGAAADSQDGGTPTTDGAGSFIGPTVTIPGYTSGSVWFIVEAYNGSSFSASISGGQYAGRSAPFLINSLQTDILNSPGDLLQISGTTATGLQPFILVVPEPSVFALAGMGAAVMMVFRQKK